MISQRFSKASKLDKAIIASVAAVLAMNVFVLAQQLDSAPTFAVTKGAPQAQQA
jgi:hypothetical protein